MPYPCGKHLCGGMGMAEAIIRRHQRRTDRWMPKKKQIITTAQLHTVAAFTARCAPAYLLAFADMMGIPSGMHAALGMALAALGMDVRPVLVGGGAAAVLRILSGLPPRWEMLLSLVVVAVCAKLLQGRGTVMLAVSAGIAVLPTAVLGCFAPTAAEMLQGWASAAIAALSAPVFVRAVKALKGTKHISSVEERVSVGYLAAMCLCGGARMLLLGFNIGGVLAAGVTLAMALVLGTGAGALTGMLSGVVLALQGVPLTVAVALSMGGFLGGITAHLSRQRLTCGAFAMGAYLPLLICGGTGLGMGASVLGAGLAMGLLPRGQVEQIQHFLRRFLNNDPAPGDAYAASALSAWERTVAAMACAVPSPKDDADNRAGTWWQERLCQGCQEYASCGCMATGLGITKAETVWAHRQTQEEIWLDALEHLRGMGCQRLYHLMDSMNVLRREDEAARRSLRQIEAQRSMLVTHLTAMSGAARRFAALSAGESWWDARAAKGIRHLLDERAVPAALSYVRRVHGHAQAAFVLESIADARKQAEVLCALTTAVTEVPMQVKKIDGDTVLLTEKPVWEAQVGMAAEPITGGKSCGDTAYSGILQDGRMLVALCDGMGHGEKAELASQQTVELLRLCLDAGYSRKQTLTAVNGMLLLGGGERFSTADVLTIDLWKGHATLDKLGAAATWLCQQGVLSRFTGDALPLGILDEIDLSGSEMRLRSGDAIVLLTDGVEDAFGSMSALERAILAAVEEESPQDAADALLASAFHADDGQRRDDQSAVVVYVRKTALQTGRQGL